MKELLSWLLTLSHPPFSTWLVGQPITYPLIFPFSWEVHHPNCLSYSSAGFMLKFIPMKLTSIFHRLLTNIGNNHQPVEFGDCSDQNVHGEAPNLKRPTSLRSHWGWIQHLLAEMQAMFWSIGNSNSWYSWTVDFMENPSYPLVSSNMAGWEIHYKWRFLAGKITELYK